MITVLKSIGMCFAIWLVCGILGNITGWWQLAFIPFGALLYFIFKGINAIDDGKYHRS